MNAYANGVDASGEGTNTYEFTRLESLPSGVRVLYLDVPGKVNVLKKAVLDELSRRLDEIKSIPGLAGLIFASGKPHHCIAGADVNEIDAVQEQSIGAAYDATEYGKAVLRKFRGLGVYSIAAIDGACQGGGLEAALWCHFRVAAKHIKTVLGLPEVLLGVFPGFGGAVLVSEVMDLLDAVDFVTKGKSIGAVEAWKRGLVDEVVAPDELIARAEAIVLSGKVNRFVKPKKKDDGLVKKIAAILHGPKSEAGSQAIKELSMLVLGKYTGKKGRAMLGKRVVAEVKKKSKGYRSPAVAAQVIMRSPDMDFEKALKLESALFAEMAQTQASKNMVDIFLDTSRAKKFPPGVKPGLIKVVGVGGAGAMGKEIAFEAAFSDDIEGVVLYDIFAEALPRAMADIEALFDARIRDGKMDPADKAAKLAKITTSCDIAAFAVCDAIVEAVRETYEAKWEFYAGVDGVMAARDNPEKPYWLFSNTSAKSLAKLASKVAFPERFCGLHFFNPVSGMRLVEVPMPEGASPECEATAIQLASMMGKLPIVCADQPGFIVNRILGAYMVVTVWLLSLGVSASDIDKAMLDIGMPMGPVTLMDHVGLDIVASVANSLHEAFGERMARPRAESDVVAILMANGLLGKKGKDTRGVYVWKDGRQVKDEKSKLPLINPFLKEAFPLLGTKRMSKEAIAAYLLTVIHNEAVRALQDKVVRETYLLDLAFIYGTGFPPSLGGPIRHIDQLGVRTVFSLSSDIAHGHDTEGNGWRANFVPCELFAQHNASRLNLYSAS